MNWLVLFLFVMIGLFGFVIAFGAPYLPTHKKQIDEALDLLDLKPGQTMLELGCGDGRVLNAAAARGIKAVGYELNPLLVIIAKLHTWRYRQLVSVRWGDFWRAEWPKVDGIFVFLLDRYMSKLDKKITLQNNKNIKLVSYAFKIPGRIPNREKNGIFYYEYF